MVSPACHCLGDCGRGPLPYGRGSKSATWFSCAPVLRAEYHRWWCAGHMMPTRETEADVTYPEAMRLVHMLNRIACLFLALAAASAQTAPKLRLMNVKAEPVTYKGKACLRLTDIAPDNTPDGARLAAIEGSDFEDGAIEVDLTGDTLPNTNPTFRGFTGMAFRVAANGAGYESFYLRPKNGRAEDQEQRNHSAQYMSAPDFPWQRLRQETPGRYEAYVDLVPGE